MHQRVEQLTFNGFEQIDKTKNLTTFVLEQFEKTISSGELRPGDYLPSEKELSFTLGVGKSSVREAINILKVLGVIEAQQGKNSRISEGLNSNILLTGINNFA